MSSRFAAPAGTDASIQDPRPPDFRAGLEAAVDGLGSMLHAENARGAERLMTSPFRFDAVVFESPASRKQAAVPTAVAPAAPRLRLNGVMACSGHSHAPGNTAELQVTAEAERAPAVSSAKMVRSSGPRAP
jgi:D-serine deaminase-like pyridoxal phosphate-dependent protein